MENPSQNQESPESRFDIKKITPWQRLYLSKAFVNGLIKGTEELRKSIYNKRNEAALRHASPFDRLNQLLNCFQDSSFTISLTTAIIASHIKGSLLIMINNNQSPWEGTTAQEVFDQLQRDGNFCDVMVQTVIPSETEYNGETVLPPYPLLSCIREYLEILVGIALPNYKVDDFESSKETKNPLFIEYLNGRRISSSDISNTEIGVLYRHYKDFINEYTNTLGICYLLSLFGVDAGGYFLHEKDGYSAQYPPTPSNRAFKKFVEFILDPETKNDLDTLPYNPRDYTQAKSVLQSLSSGKYIPRKIKEGLSDTYFSPSVSERHTLILKISKAAKSAPPKEHKEIPDPSKKIEGYPITAKLLLFSCGLAITVLLRLVILKATPFLRENFEPAAPVISEPGEIMDAKIKAENLQRECRELQAEILNVYYEKYNVHKDYVPIWYFLINLSQAIFNRTEDYSTQIYDINSELSQIMAQIRDLETKPPFELSGEIIRNIEATKKIISSLQILPPEKLSELEQEIAQSAVELLNQKRENGFCSGESIAEKIEYLHNKIFQRALVDGALIIPTALSVLLLARILAGIYKAVMEVWKK